MGFRVVWPALISIVGEFILTVFGAFLVPLALLSGFGTAESPGRGFGALLPFGSILLSGLFGLYLSFRLSSHEEDHRRIGILLLSLFSITSYFIFQWFFSIISNEPGPIPILTYVIASSPLWVLFGGIWAFFWKAEENPHVIQSF